MRKWIFLVLFVLVLVFVFVYLLIPNNIAIKEKAMVSFSAKAFARSLMNENTWAGWWPGQPQNNRTTPTSFSYNGNQYTLTEKTISSLLLTISKGTDSLQTELVLIPVESDSVELEWVGTAQTALNPVARLQKNHWVKGIKNDMQTLLQTIEAFYTTEDNLYAFPIRKDFVKDSTLISTAATFPQYPTTEAIYNLIDKLKAFAQKNGARQTGFPMLNITPNADSTYSTKVALPVDKVLKDEGDIRYRWMLGGGNILVADVNGGPHRIQKAFDEMEVYINDFRRVAPAIPFQSLVTDRRTEPDTAKWVTKLYWPVM